MRGHVSPSVMMSLGHAIENALTKTESAKDKEFAERLVKGFRDAAAKAEALAKSLPDPEPTHPRWP